MRGRVPVVVLLMLAAACSDSAQTTTTTVPVVITASTTTTTMPPATTSTSTTSTATTTTTLAPGEDDRWLQDEPPELDLTVSDTGDVREFERVLDEINLFTRWLALHPTTDPEVLAIALVPNGPQWRVAMEAAQTQVTEGWVLRAPRSILVIPALFPLEDASDDVIELVATRETDGELVKIDAITGETLEVFTIEDLSAPLSFELRRSESGEWRLWEERLRA